VDVGNALPTKREGNKEKLMYDHEISSVQISASWVLMEIETLGSITPTRPQVDLQSKILNFSVLVVIVGRMVKIYW
jgi:hypothetical protein